jgi:hypothetical protein
MARRPRQESLWARRESWIILACTIIVLLLVLAAIGYMSGRWGELPSGYGVQ